MKKIFLGAVAIAALCSSCETAGEDILLETPAPTAMAAKTAGRDASADYMLYKTLMKGFAYNPVQTYENNVAAFVRYANAFLQQQPQQSMKIAGYGNETIDAEVLAQLNAGGAEQIDRLAYSPQLKQLLYVLIYENLSQTQLNAADLAPEEQQLLQTLWLLHNEEGDDDEVDDEKLDRKRTIAFAYGAQHSFAQAVLYAGAVELKKK